MQNKSASVLDAIKAAAKALPVSHEVRPIHHALCDAGAAVAELIAATKQYMAAELLEDIIAAEARLEAALTHAGEAP